MNKSVVTIWHINSAAYCIVFLHVHYTFTLMHTDLNTHKASFISAQTWTNQSSQLDTFILLPAVLYFYTYTTHPHPHAYRHTQPPWQGITCRPRGWSTGVNCRYSTVSRSWNDVIGMWNVLRQSQMQMHHSCTYSMYRFSPVQCTYVRKYQVPDCMSRVIEYTSNQFVTHQWMD
jgi:hypothetical protein